MSVYENMDESSCSNSVLNQLTLGDSLGSAGLPVKETRKCYYRNDGKQTGLQVVFENGMTLSIQWHSGAYSNVGRGFWEPGEEPTFEAAAWYPYEVPSQYDGEPTTAWFNPDPRYSGDDVLPYVTIHEVLEFARKVAAHTFVVPCVSNFGKAIALVAGL